VPVYVERVLAELRTRAKPATIGGSTVGSLWRDEPERFGIECLEEGSTMVFRLSSRDHFCSFFIQRSGTPGRAPNLSFSSSEDSCRQVGVEQDGLARTVTSAPGDRLRASSSPDGERFRVGRGGGAFFRRRRKGRGDSDPSEIRVASDAEVSRDGEWMTFSLNTGETRDNDNLVRVRVDGTSLTPAISPGNPNAVSSNCSCDLVDMF